MTEIIPFILVTVITVIVVISIIWHQQISLAFLQVIAGRRIKRPFMSAETLEKIEIECGIIEKPPARHGLGPPPNISARIDQIAQDIKTLAESHKALEQKYVVSMGEIDTIETPVEQTAAAVINNRRRAHHG